MKDLMFDPEDSRHPVEWFSRREREVLSGLCRAESNQQIAHSLNMSVGAVKRRISGLLKRLSLSDRAELTRWTLQHPEVLQEGKTRDLKMHPDGCECPAPFCAAMRGRAA